MNDIKLHEMSFIYDVNSMHMIVASRPTHHENPTSSWAPPQKRRSFCGFCEA